MSGIYIAVENESVRKRIKFVIKENLEKIETKIIDVFDRPRVVILDDTVDITNIKYHCDANGASNILMVLKNNNISKIYKMMEIGICNYIYYKFDKEEFITRIKMMELKNNDKITVGGVELFTKKYMLVYENRSIQLSKRECSIIECLLSNRGRVVSKESLYNQITEYESDAEFRIITEYVYSIRKKLKKIGINCIETIYGVGYRWRYV